MATEAAPTPRSVIGGSAALVSARYGQALLGYAGNAIIARSLSKADYGGYALVFSVLGILGILCDVQASRLVVKDVLDDESDAGRVVGSYMTLRLLVALVAYVFAVALIGFGGYPDEVVRGAFLGASALVLAATWSALNLYFRAHLWLRTLAVVMVLAQALQLGLTIAIASSGSASITSFMWPAVAFDIFTFVALIAIASRHIRLRPSIDLRQWKEWIKESVPLVIGASLATIYFRLDAVMLSKLDTLEATGVYIIGYKFSDLIGYVPYAIIAPVFVLMVQSWPDDIDGFRKTFRGAFVLLVMPAVGLTVAFAMYAEPAITSLYGDRFRGGATAARLLVVGQGLHFLTDLSVVTLQATRRHKLYPIATLAGVVLNVGLNLVLIPHLSIEGSGLATIITEIGVLAVLVPAVRRIEGTSAPMGVVWRSLAASAVMVIVGLGTRPFMPWPLSALLAGTSFLGVLHVIGIDGPGGLRALRHQLKPVDRADAIDAQPREPFEH
jgi:O-antigen/teichoic acid export membrane protein